MRRHTSPSPETPMCGDYWSDITTGIGALALAQQDGGLPTTLAAGSAPGESGLTVISVRFQGSFHLTATLRQHLVCFQWPLSRQLPFECRTVPSPAY
jgi:hypothetical protein